jgi:hypothetical protein
VRTGSEGLFEARVCQLQFGKSCTDAPAIHAAIVSRGRHPYLSPVPRHERHDGCVLGPPNAAHVADGARLALPLWDADVGAAFRAADDNVPTALQGPRAWPVRFAIVVTDTGGARKRPDDRR